MGRTAAMKCLQSCALAVLLMGATVQGFVSPSAISLRQTLSSASSPDLKRGLPTLLHERLWERLEIDEDPEPMWYLLNCIAGLELDLLNQCRLRCSDMGDVVKFVVPMVKATRSHGPNRIVTEMKVKYQGYVFANLRLTKQTYEAIQKLDLCRSWMGTVNRKGYRKLPPAPIALNEVEIENFGLDDLEEGMEQPELEDDEPTDGVILDTEEEDERQKKRIPKIDEAQLAEYQNLRPDDMIKVTADNRFKGEDGIVKRLKDGKIMVRFYTYGSMYDEWLDPGEVRKMSNEEILRGLSGPSTPITQADFDGGGPMKDKWSNRKGPGGLRDSLMQNVAGNQGPRNRRRDRVERGDYGRRSVQDQARNLEQEEKNWAWYQEQRRGNNALRDGQVELGIGSRRDQKDWAADADAQWGRYSKRRMRRERQTPNKAKNRRVNEAIDGGDDWSSFVSNSEDSKSGADDAFFDSLMSELDNEGESPARKNAAAKKKEEDDFFSSLMNELNGEQQQPRQQESKSRMPKNQEKDFFAALEAELGNAAENSPTSTKDDTDDFFAKLEEELKLETRDEVMSQSSPSESNEDIFSSLFEREAGSGPETTSSGAEPESTAPNHHVDDFFSYTDGGDLPNPEATQKVPKKRPAKEQASGGNGNGGGTPSGDTPGLDQVSLDKKKVPELKDMLRERGLKVSGKKSELIERLRQG